MSSRLPLVDGAPPAVVQSQPPLLPAAGFSTAASTLAPPAPDPPAPGARTSLPPSATLPPVPVAPPAPELPPLPVAPPVPATGA